METYEVSIELDDTLAVSVSFDEEIEVEIAFCADTSDSECPTIDEIDGGDSTDDSQFDIINGFLNGGDADPFA
jgi:hypothetical protein